MNPIPYHPDLDLTKCDIAVSGMPAKVYHARPEISKHRLDLMADCPLKFAHANGIIKCETGDEEEPKKEKAALKLGNQLHALMFTPEQFAADYAIEPKGMPKRPTQKQLEAKNPKAEHVEAEKVWVEFETANKGREVLDRVTYFQLTGMRDSLYRDERTAAFLVHEALTETAIFRDCPETGIRLRHMLDRSYPWARKLADLKTARSAKREFFAKDAFEYRYDVQAFLYADAMRQLLGEDELPEFFFVIVETDPPYATNVIQAPPEYMEKGQERWREVRDLYLRCKESNTWPSYGSSVSGSIEQLHVPAWAKQTTYESRNQSSRGVVTTKRIELTGAIQRVQRHPSL